MLSDSNYYALYLAKMKADELRGLIENRDLKKNLWKESNKRIVIKSHILEGAGKFLVKTGNKLLRIA